MSSEEYTIDIQLTELGFPNIMLASSDTSSPPSSPSPPPPPQSADEESPRGSADVARVPGGQIQITMVRGATPTAARASQPASLPPARRGSETTTRLQVNGLDRMTRVQPGNGNRQEQTATGQAYGAGRAVARGGVEVELEESESDSDDSEVSEVEEEEEDDDDEDAEGEGLNVDIESTSGEYRCSVCELTLPSNIKLQEHMNQHTGTRPYCCAECGKRFCQIYNYRLHLRTHAQTRVTKPVVCRICLKDFDTEAQLQFHFTQNHFEKEFYECDLCKRIFTDLKLCEQHMEWHQRSVRCDTCGRTFHSDKSLKRHQHKRCQRTYNCTDCLLKFSRKNALLKHSFTHLGLLPYTCIRCQRHFRLAKLYRQHKCEPQSIHCVACLRVFYNQVDFQKHKKDTGCWGHQGSKGDEIRCMECGKSFTTKEELKKHAGVHQRLLSCAECGKGFHSALLLMSHMGGHAGQSPCLCQRCGLGFPHQQEYDGHLKHCGRARPPAGAPKKRPPSSKTVAPPAKKLRPLVTEPGAGVTVTPSVPDSSPVSLVSVKPPEVPTAAKSPSVNLAVSIAPGLSNGPTLRLDQTCGPQGVSVGGGPGGAGPSGVWQIALDKKPPPGANLVLFVPVASPLANGLAGINQAQPLVLQPHQLSAALQSAAGGDVGAALHKATSLIPGLMPGGLSRLTNSVVTQLQAGGPLGLTLDTHQVEDGADMKPLDLSTKKSAPVESSSSSSLDVPRPSVKKEPESPEELAVADGEGTFQCSDADSKLLEVKREPQLRSVRADADKPLEVKAEAVTVDETQAGLDTVDETTDDVDSDAGELTVDLDAVDETTADLDTSGELTVDLDAVHETTADLDTAGELTADLDAVGETTADLDTAGETTADLDTSGELTVDLDAVHETTADLDTAGELTADLDTAGETTADLDTAGETTADLDTAGELTADLDAVDETTADLDTAAGELTADLDTAGETTAELDTAVDETTADLDTAAGELTADLDTAGETTAELDTAVDETTADLDTAGQTKHDADNVQKAPETPS